MVGEILERTKKLVWPEIEKYLKDPIYPTQFEIPKEYSKDADLYWKINHEYPERKGKYLRPTLVLLVAEALGVKTEDAVGTAAAMQISEEWMLIHDDIEDNSEERREKPTLHKMYGMELALNAGDALNTIMWKVVNDQKSKKISDEFYNMILRTTLGQGVEQIWTNNKDKELTDDKYFFVADSKSGYYSIGGPMRLGAILGNVTKDRLNLITEFGLHLGRCFQIVDDILDSEQDKKEGKLTIVSKNGIPYAQKLAEKERDKAYQIFNNDLGFLNHEPARKSLLELINFILERKS